MKKTSLTLLRYLLYVFIFSIMMWAIVSLMPGIALSQPDKEMSTVHADRSQISWLFSLDEPLPVRYMQYYAHAFTGNWGQSWVVQPGAPVIDLFLQKLPYSLVLLGISLLFTGLLTIPTAIYSAVHSPDGFFTKVFMVGSTLPIFWIGTLLFVVAMLLHIPTYTSAQTRSTGQMALVLALPVLLVIIFVSYRWFQLTYKSVSKALKDVSLQAGSIEELSERQFLVRYVLPAAGKDFLPIFLRNLPVPLFGATIYAETIFGWPGVGQLYVNALASLDWPVIQAFILPPAGAFLLGYLLYGLLTDTAASKTSVPAVKPQALESELSVLSNLTKH